jgi:beta-lactamase regulating signal transducer with metallopeptidase domain
MTVTALWNGLVWNAAEATLLALVVAAGVRLARPSAPVRHALWLIVLLRLVLPPIGVHTLGLSSGCGRVALQFVGHDFGSLAKAPPHDATNRIDRLQPVTTTALIPVQVQDPDAAATEGETIADSAAAAETTGDDTPGGTGKTNSPVSPSLTLPTLRGGGNAVANSALPDDSLAMSPPDAGNETGSPSPTAPAPSFRWTVPESAQIALLWLWLSGSTGLLLLRAVQCFRMIQIIRRAAPASPDLSASCTRLAAAIGLRQPPRVCVVRDAMSPTVCALGRATIVLPASLGYGCDPTVARTVLAHELAHVKRRDHWTCWVELIAGLMYWWHPATWWARRQMRNAADEAADSLAVSIVGGRQKYAEALLETAELLVADRTVAAVWGPALGERDTLARRLTMIMKGPLSHRLSWPSWLGVGVVGLFALGAAPPAPSVQDAKAAPEQVEVATPPSEEEFGELVNLLEQGGPGQAPRARRIQEPRGPVPPQPPERGQPPGQPDRPERRGNPDQRLNELEQKVDRILQVLEGMQGGGRGFGGGFPGGFGGGPGQPGAPGAQGVAPGFSPFGGGFGAGAGAPQAPGAAPQGGMSGMGMGRMGGGMAGGMSGAPSGMGGFGRSATPTPPGVPAVPGMPGAPAGPGGPGGPGGRMAPGGAGPGDVTRGLDLSPEKRERLESMQREIREEINKIEAEQNRMMAEFQRRRAELERKQADMMREILGGEPREGGRREGLRGRGGERRPDNEGPRDGRGERRPDGDRPREGGSDRRPDGDRPGGGGDRRPEGERPSNETI